MCALLLWMLVHVLFMFIKFILNILANVIEKLPLIKDFLLDNWTCFIFLYICSFTKRCYQNLHFELKEKNCVCIKILKFSILDYFNKIQTVKLLNNGHRGSIKFVSCSEIKSYKYVFVEDSKSVYNMCPFSRVFIMQVLLYFFYN